MLLDWTLPPPQGYPGGLGAPFAQDWTASTLVQLPGLQIQRFVLLRVSEGLVITRLVLPAWTGQYPIFTVSREVLPVLESLHVSRMILSRNIEDQPTMEAIFSRPILMPTQQ